jgi:hypothetical protein
MTKDLKLIIAVAFLTGYFLSNVINDLGIKVISETRADIYGMDYYDLKSDSDFKRAVMSIVEENCATAIRVSDHKTWHYCGSNSSYAP